MRPTITIAFLVSILTLSPNAPASAGSALTTTCRGGSNHGDPCRDDADCAGGDNTTTGICTYRSMPRACIGTHYCAVSQSIECRGNDDCTAFRGGTWPANPNDFCSSFDHYVTGCDPSSADSGDALDCGECSGGPFKGRGCLGDGHCPEATCDKSPGLGKCSNGASQCELQRRGHKGYAAYGPGDVLADLLVGQREIGNNVERSNSARTIIAPGDVEIFCDRLYVSESRRITGRNYSLARAENHSSADAFIGQIDARTYKNLRISDDTNASIIPLLTAETVESIYRTGTTPYRRIECIDAPDLSGCLVGDWHRLLLHPYPMRTDSAATRVWGHSNFTGSRLFASDARLNAISGIAAMRRCAGGAQIGAPCADDSGCPASECATTVAVADSDLHRIVVQRSPDDNDDSTWELALGQPDLETVGCNRGGLSASTLCEPAGITFDAHGNLWVADAGNHRVLRYPRDFAAAASADIVLGQSSFTESRYGSSASEMQFPVDVAYDAKRDILFVADKQNSRVLRFDRPDEGGAADGAFGQASFDTSDNGFSSDGVACDRFAFPLGIDVDATSGMLWVADTVNNRVLAFDYANDEAPDATPARRFHGQPDCGTRFEGEVDAISIGKGSAGVWFFGSDPQGVCIGDETANRVLCWKDRALPATTKPDTTPADFILGQASSAEHRPNRGASATANTLYAPSFGTSPREGTYRDRILVADTENNRVVVFEPPFATGMDAAAVLGQPDFESTACSASPRGMCGPNSVKSDRFGNLWVADSGNGRVLLFCHAANTVDAAGGGFVCGEDESGDAVADLVLGRVSFEETFSETACTTPNGATLCQPWDITFDPTRNRVIVGDRDATLYGRGRTLVYAAPFSNGMAARYVLGIPSNSLTTYIGSNAGFCNGGPRAGNDCNGTDSELQGEVSEACGRGGHCDWSRSFPGGAVEFDARHDVLYVDHGGSTAEILYHRYPEPTPSPGTGVRMGRVFGATNEATYDSQGIGYTACQWARQYGQMSMDADGNLWAQQGSIVGEHNPGVVVLLDPAGGAPKVRRATPTPSRAAAPPGAGR